MEVSTDDVHDIKAFPGLVEKAERRRRRVKEALGDGAYDSGMVYEMLEARGDRGRHQAEEEQQA